MARIKEMTGGHGAHGTAEGYKAMDERRTTKVLLTLQTTLRRCPRQDSNLRPRD